MGSVPWSSAFARTRRRRWQRWRRRPPPRLLQWRDFLLAMEPGSALACRLFGGLNRTPQGTKEAARPRRQPPRGLQFVELARATPLSAPPPLLTEPHLFGEMGPSCRVVRRHHRIVRRQSPFLAVLLRRHVVLRAQMTLEGLEFLSVLQANDIVRRDRLLE